MAKRTDPEDGSALALATAGVHAEMGIADAKALRSYGGAAEHTWPVIGRAMAHFLAAQQHVAAGDGVRALCHTLDGKGLLLHAAGACIGVALNGQRDRAVRAGSLGGAARGEKYAALKRWALAEAASMPLGADKQVAKTLANRLPHDLADVSQDPERMIYEALLKRHKAAVA